MRARAPTKKFNFPRVVYVFYTLQKKKKVQVRARAPIRYLSGYLVILLRVRLRFSHKNIYLIKIKCNFVLMGPAIN